MDEKNKFPIFYLIIIVIFLATLYAAARTSSSSPEVEQKKETLALKEFIMGAPLYATLLIFTYVAGYYIFKPFKNDPKTISKIIKKIKEWIN